MRARRHGKDVVELLERALLRLGQPEEDHPEGGEVERGVEAKGTLGPEGAEHARQRQRQDRRPEVIGRDGPRHADLAVGEREDFGRVSEGDGAFAGGVEGVEKVDDCEGLKVLVEVIF